VDVNDPQFGYAFTSSLRATQASLQEFRVTTSNYNADAGRSSAAQVQLETKSGSNDIHGQVYWGIATPPPMPMISSSTATVWRRASFNGTSSAPPWAGRW
jgi:hypothetical protein